MKHAIKIGLWLSILPISFSSGACSSNEELEQRLENRNDTYHNVQSRRGMRKDARQERTDAWYDRAMH